MAPPKDRLWLLVSSRRTPSSLLCRSCLRAAVAQRKNYSTISTAATAASPIPSEENLESRRNPKIEEAEEDDDSSEDTPLPPLSPQDRPILSHKIKASILLSRPPLLTRELHPFEKAYFLYQKRLNERLALPFTRYQYYEKNTPGETEWKRKIKERLTPARDIGVYSGFGSNAWNDEVLVGSEIGDPENAREALVKDSEVEVKRRNEDGEEEIVKEVAERPMPRRTEADENGDTRTLNRALTRTLYLLVRTRNPVAEQERQSQNTQQTQPGDKRKIPGKWQAQERGEWRFPESELLFDEALHMAARRIIVEAAGTGMNTWVVGKVPIGHHVLNYPQPLIGDEKSKDESRQEKTTGGARKILGEKGFYMKARIMAGRADLKNNSLGLLDYQWLAKDEIQKVLSPFDWSAVKNILAER